MSEKTKKKRGAFVRKRPSEYPVTEAQTNLLKSAEYCGIKKGITRKELMDKMVNCVPEYFKKLKEEGKDGKEADHSLLL